MLVQKKTWLTEGGAGLNSMSVWKTLKYLETAGLIFKYFWTIVS